MRVGVYYSARLPDPLRDRSFGSSSPSITSTTGTYFLSLAIEATLGSLLFDKLTMTTRRSEAEVVSLRLEVDCANSAI